jgi:dihydrolipoamide dehydrogenase
MGTEVTVVEFMPNIVPIEDEDIFRTNGTFHEKGGSKIMTNSSVEKLILQEKGVKAFVKNS